jgi:hypothetical protein
MVLEELATADAGLAALLTAAPVPFRWAGDTPRRRLREMSLRYLEGKWPDWSGCWTAGPCPPLRATASDRGWVLGGRAPSVLGAAIATHAALGCVIEVDGGRRPALAIVELERRGITRRPESERLGLRAECRAELLLEGVFVSGEELVFTGPPGMGRLARATAVDHLIGAISAVGIARAAYQAAFRFAREQPHAGATVQERRRSDRLLAQLRSRLCHVRRSTGAAHAQRNPSGAPDEPALEQAAVARLLAIDVALEMVHATSEICTRATNALGEIEFLDGSTLWLEKLLRDARSLGDRGSGFARGGRPEPIPAIPRSIGWTQPSSLASG